MINYFVLHVFSVLMEEDSHLKLMESHLVSHQDGPLNKREEGIV